ncbi:MAG: glycerol-3-phosphate acyltransferase [Lentisphaeria bacterium]|nr:glycerol-3-phosphate acyltransferase [Lentisphaeria bacterium]
MIYAIITIILAYFLGGIPSGFLIGKYHGIDIRTVGSCNTGATNVTRCIGKKAGIFCFFCDCNIVFIFCSDCSKIIF